MVIEKGFCLLIYMNVDQSTEPVDHVNRIEMSQYNNTSYSLSAYKYRFFLIELKGLVQNAHTTLLE